MADRSLEILGKGQGGHCPTDTLPDSFGKGILLARAFILRWSHAYGGGRVWHPGVAIYWQRDLESGQIPWELYFLALEKKTMTSTGALVVNSQAQERPWTI